MTWAGNSPDELSVDFDLAPAIAGYSLMMDLPALVNTSMPQIGKMADPLDPTIGRDKMEQGFLLVSPNFMDLWRWYDFTASLARGLARSPKLLARSRRHARHC